MDTTLATSRRVSLRRYGLFAQLIVSVPMERQPISRGQST